MSIENVISEQLKDDHSVPWTVKDTWLGLSIFVLLLIGMLIIFLVWQNNDFLQTIGLLITELLFIVPVIFILAKRKAPWTTLGFRKFRKENLAIGCGLLIAVYTLVMIHNLLLVFFGFTTQGEQIYQLFGNLDSPFWLILVGVVLAPLIEEIFFRGFLFGGFRQRFGWNKAALISSTLFAFAHVQLITLIPTFLLGYLFAYIFHKSNSLWPGIILHFSVNLMGLCAITALTQVNF